MRPGIYGAAWQGGRARLVRVEAVLGRGLSRVVLVGMPDPVAREARERLPAAFARHGFAYPRGKILFNLVPSQWPKGGLPLDLALAASLLAADGQLPPPREPWLLLAELDLEGRLGAPARGTLLAALAARGAAAGLVTAPGAAAEAALAPGLHAWGLPDLGAVADFFRQTGPARPAAAAPAPAPRDPAPPPQLEEVRGQPQARLAAMVAAAGRHALLLQGPPGTGKSLLARRIPGLLPDLRAHEALEVAQVEARLGPVPALPRRPPFRAPHASISTQGLLGGGRPLRPGELSRAHRGVLFLDELPEFARPVLEGLRQPLEDREIRLQRAQEWAVFPAEVLLVAARNPCPCGYASHPTVPCVCTPGRVQRYRTRTSGPLLDRFDLFVEMGPVRAEDLQGPPTPPGQAEALAALQRAATLQARRSPPGGPRLWNQAATREQIRHWGIEAAADARLAAAVDSLPLSGRGALRALRVARSLADLEGSEGITSRHVALALSFRMPPAAEGISTA